MIINEEKKIILLHNPKTGGLSFEIYINIFNKKNNIRIYHNNKGVFNYIWCDHATFNMVYDIYGDEYTYYTFIRNPYNRYISAINYIKDEHMWNNDLGEKSFLLSPTDKIGNLNSIILNKETIFNIQDGLWYPHLLYQSEYINNKVNILKYESNEDWEIIKKIFDIPNYKVKIKKNYDISKEEIKLIDFLYREKDSEIYNIYNL